MVLVLVEIYKQADLWGEGLWYGRKIIAMIMEEASVWFLSQSLEQQEEHKEKKDEERIKKRWSKPYQNWLAYKKSQTAGCSWMVRDSKGDVKWHSRRSFTGILNLINAKVCAI